MTTVSDSAELRFGPFRLLGRHGPLFRDSAEIRLPPKAIAVLWALIRQNGEVLSRAALIDAVWPGTPVGDEALTFQIQTLRKALEDDPKAPRYLLTVHRVGFRFGLPVQQGRAAPAKTLFVGRAPELERLAAGWRAALAGERRLLVVTGEAGVGKSELIERFLAGLAEGARVPRIARGHCVERQQQGEPYLPVLEAIGRLVHEATDDIPLELLRRVAPTWLLHLPALLEPAELAALRRRTAGSSQARMLREMAELLELLGEREPLVLVLEDLHWSDPATLHLLGLLAGRRLPARLLLLASARPPGEDEAGAPLRQLLRELGARGALEPLPLGYLGLGEVRDYLARRGAGLAADPTRVQRIYARSAGHPLFMVQLTDYLLREPALADPATDEAQALPPRLRDLIELQLAQLPLAEQLLLEVASVSAQEFTAAAVAHGAGLDLAPVDAQLERLARQGRFVEDRGLAVWPDGSVGGRYAFRHVLYQVALRQRLSASREARLHLQIAERMEAAYGARAETIAAELADHFEAGGQPERALAYCVQTAARALARLAPVEVRQQSARGLRLVDGLAAGAARDRAEMSLRILIVNAWQLEQGYATQEAPPHLLRMQALVASVREPALLEPALASLWLFHHFRCLLEAALGYAGDIRDLGRALGRPVLECSGIAWASNSLHLLGRHREAATAARDAIDIARRHAPPPGSPESAAWQAACTALASRAIVGWFLGEPDSALRWAQEARHCAERTGNPATLCTLHSMLTSILLFRRDWQALVQACDEATALCERHSHLDGLEWAQMHRLVGLAHLDADPAPQLDALRVLTARRHRTNVYIGLPSIYVSEAELHLSLGRHGAARAALDKARELVMQRQMRAWEPELLRVEAGLVLAQGGSTAEAGAPLRQALEIARERGALSLALRSASALVRLCGTPERSVLAQVCAALPEGLDTPDRIEAEALLAGG